MGVLPRHLQQRPTRQAGPKAACRWQWTSQRARACRRARALGGDRCEALCIAWSGPLRQRTSGVPSVMDVIPAAAAPQRRLAASRTVLNVGLVANSTIDVRWVDRRSVSGLMKRPRCQKRGMSFVPPLRLTTSVPRCCDGGSSTRHAAADSGRECDALPMTRDPEKLSSLDASRRSSCESCGQTRLCLCRYRRVHAHGWRYVSLNRSTPL